MNDTPVLKADDVDVNEILSGIDICRPKRGQRFPVDKNTGEKYKYLDIVCAFDIETSKRNFGDDDHPEWHGWMYIWQFQFGDRCTVIGRTWEEFRRLIFRINDYLPESVRLLVYVHKLEHEFQYLSGIWAFGITDVFATDVRNPLHCEMKQVEFRCSFRLSGYSLAKWAERCGVDHAKLLGVLDYEIERYPWTELSPEELQYCINDVIVVVECVTEMLHSYGDNLYSIPYTMVGYIRRRIRAGMWVFGIDQVRNMYGDLKTYDRLRDAYRGGDAHANRYWANSIIGDVFNYDRSSSYPDVLCHCKFPMTKFREIKAPGLYDLQEQLDHGKAVLMKVGFLKLRLRDPQRTGLPYIPMSWCEKEGYQKPYNVTLDENRILAADYVEMTITDVDFEIISQQYDYDGLPVFFWMMAARYGNLPRPVIDTLVQLFKIKTSLKGVDPVMYDHIKQELNSVYGLMAQKVFVFPTIYDHGEWKVDGSLNRERLYKEGVERSFVNYAWGVWCTAWARYRLHQGIAMADASETEMDISPFVYADTDSIKCRNPIDFTEYNNARIRDAKRSGAFAQDRKGRIHYMGTFDDEGTYDLFKVLRVKAYCSVKDGKVTITVSGVPKEEGSLELESKGGIISFDDGLIFQDSGRTGGIYNDDDYFHYRVDQDPDHSILITKNVCIIKAEYSMNLSTNYKEIVRALSKILDSKRYPDYTGRR